MPKYLIIGPKELKLERYHLDLIRPNLENQVQTKQIYQKSNKGGRAGRSFISGAIMVQGCI